MSQQPCANCGTSNAINTKFCTECGTALITLPAKVSPPAQALAVPPPIEVAQIPMIGAAGLIKNSNIIQNVYHQSSQKDPKEIYSEAVYAALQNKGVIDAAARAILKSLQAALSLTDLQTLRIQEEVEALYRKHVQPHPPSPPPAPAPPPSPPLLPTVARYHYTGPTGQKEGTEDEILSWIIATPTSEHHIWQAGWPDWRDWKGVDSLKAKIEKLLPQPPKPVIISLPAPTPPSSAPSQALAGFVLIQPGRFTMGSPMTEKGRYKSETQHPVEITKPFYLQITPVTQREWQTMIGNNPSHFKGDFDRPVEMVSWFDAVAYCNALSRKEGLNEAYTLAHIQGYPGTENFTCSVEWTGFESNGYRLPTEAEWEYAARAGTTTAFYNGDCFIPEGEDANLDQIAWYNTNSGRTTHPVKGQKPNLWGLYDMLGNVWEWCWDWFGDYSSTLQRDPIGGSGGSSRPSNRVLRGGSWYYYAWGARAAYRRGNGPGGHYDDVGFRPARSNCSPTVSARYHYASPTSEKEGTEDEIVSWIVAAPTGEHQIWQEGWPDWRDWKGVDALKVKVEKILPSTVKPLIINPPVIAPAAAPLKALEKFAQVQPEPISKREIRDEKIHQKIEITQEKLLPKPVTISLPAPALPALPTPTPPKTPEGFVLIQPGHFMMGSPASEKGRSRDETQHLVEIARSFFLKIIPVTQKEWQVLMGNNPSHFKGNLNRPVETVSWFDAVAYCNAMSRKEGFSEAYTITNIQSRPGESGYICVATWKGFDCNGYRLPTEAEWEYAARGYAARAGTTTAFYNGDCLEPKGKDKNLDQIGWYSENSSGTTHPVKGKKSNLWGLYDMSGNVWEWCWDWRDTYPSAFQCDPIGPSSGGPYRVLRGGSWNSNARYCRAAFRNGGNPDLRNSALGVRIVRSNL